VQRNCNLIVAHHPIVFQGMKKINGKNYVERAVVAAIKNDIAIYAIHTNLDNILLGVNDAMADRLGLVNRKILSPKHNLLVKLFTFVPIEKAEIVRNALFEAGAGNIGKYDDCSFNIDGFGTFKAGEGTNPFVGEQGKLHQEKETKIEVILPTWLTGKVVAILKNIHPYEEPAFDIVPLVNELASVGSGLIGELPEPLLDSKH
jgi:hypothetical protein